MLFGQWGRGQWRIVCKKGRFCELPSWATPFWDFHRLLNTFQSDNETNIWPVCSPTKTLHFLWSNFITSPCQFFGKTVLNFLQPPPFYYDISNISCPRCYFELKNCFLGSLWVYRTKLVWTTNVPVTQNTSIFENMIFPIFR